MNRSIRHRAALIRGGKVFVFAAAILGATKLTLEFATVTGVPTAAFSFLIIVLLSAYFGGLPVAIATSCVATLCFDYFYLPPVGTFNISSFADWISLVAFLLASVIISRLTASAAENAARVRVLNTTLVQMKAFGEWMLSLPREQPTLSGIAKEALRVFSLDYCSIHVYGEGKWQHFTGAAASELPLEIEGRLKLFQDHLTEMMVLAEEDALGVRYVQINRGSVPLALLAVKSETLPSDAMGAIACLIGVHLGSIIKDQHSLHLKG